MRARKFLLSTLLILQSCGGQIDRESPPPIHLDQDPKVHLTVDVSVQHQRFCQPYVRGSLYDQDLRLLVRYHNAGTDDIFVMTGWDGVDGLVIRQHGDDPTNSSAAQVFDLRGGDSLPIPDEYGPPKHAQLLRPGDFADSIIEHMEHFAVEVGAMSIDKKSIFNYMPHTRAGHHDVRFRIDAEIADSMNGKRTNNRRTEILSQPVYLDSPANPPMLLEDCSPKSLPDGGRHDDKTPQ